MLQSLVTPALPTIQHELHSSQSTTTWVLTAYLLSASVFTPILGRVGDMVGKKRTLVAATTALAVGCLLAALAPSIGVLILGRVVQGAGGAVFPLSFGIIRDEFEPARIPAAVGAFAAVLAVGSGLGVVLAGPVISALDYHWLFWIPVAVVTAATLAAHLLIPESRVRTRGRVNWAAAGLLAAGLVALLLPISQATSWGWGSARVLGLLAAAAVLLVAWVLTEARSATPLIDMRIMRLPGVWTTNSAALLFGAGMFGVFAFLPQLVQIPREAGYGFGASVTEAGLLMLPMLVTMFVFGIVSGRVQGVFSAKAQLATGAVLCGLPCASLAAWHGERWQIGLAAGVFGAGIGLAFSAMTNLIVGSVPPQQTGAASGMNANIRTVGGAIGAAVMSTVVTGNPRPDGLPREAGFSHGFLVLTLLCLAAALAACLVPAARRAPARQAAGGAAEAPRESGAERATAAVGEG
ncbi:MFS transporter [Streptomyces hoynatensis]|uniref:MFS transporter n=2 Tax=Streptomyces hoynatensis TaxID=1141874 RepID=A0A3A9YZ79_9ACTN|nr:MFS transporter [Streptomyces hoynatensis]